MEIIKTPIEGLLIIKPDIFGDERGYFFESWSRKLYKNIGLDLDFVQDNQSLSQKGVLRGLHFQNPPFAQGKLVRVIKGSVIDVAVDIRKESKTYGDFFSIELSEVNKKVFWIPPGFAHGFISLQNDTIFHYKCTASYNKNAEESLLWNDPDLNIAWGIDNPLVSEKDMVANNFKDLKSQF
tara:strand:- start:68 stop:610 length:543 start_codon:yes stop_codon:yes gene_type:complete